MEADPDLLNLQDVINSAIAPARINAIRNYSVVDGDIIGTYRLGSDLYRFIVSGNQYADEPIEQVKTDSVRPSCLECVTKHLSSAAALMQEAENGYPDHAFLVFGELSEAEKESLDQYPQLAAQIRDLRKEYYQTGESIPFSVFVDLLRSVGAWRTDSEIVQALKVPQLEAKSDAAIPDKYSHVSFVPPVAVRKAFKRGLENYRKHKGGKGLEPVTVREAIAISRGESVAPAKVVKAYRWFARNQRFAKMPASSPAGVAWGLWGYSEFDKWVKRTYLAMQAADKESDRHDASRSCPGGYKIPLSKKCRDPNALKSAAKHAGEHLAENVASWGLGKIVGGAIAQIGVAHGISPEVATHISETAVQALAATALHARKRQNRNTSELANKFISEAAAAYMGKFAHTGVDDAITGGDEHVRAIAALIAGKTTGLATAATVAAGLRRQSTALKRLLAPKRNDDISSDLSIREDAGLSQSDGEDLFDLTLAGVLLAIAQKKRSQKIKNAIVKLAPFDRQDADARPCGRGWQGTKPGCTRSNARKNKAPESQKKTTQSPKASKSKKDPIPPPGSVAEIDPSLLNVDPKRFQYKIIGEHTKTGEVGSLSGVQRFDPNLAGIIQVWKDPSDGKTYVVNGHNRLALANRLGAEKVTVRTLDVKDAKEARAVGALTNIAEGRGTALDAAKFFKDTGLSKSDLDKKGIPMREKIATDGIALSKLDDSLFRKVIDGQIPVERAVIIGGSGLESQQQRDLYDLSEQQAKRGRKITNDVLSELVDTVKASESRQETQFDLFGGSEVTKTNAIERASLQASVKKRLSRDKKLFGLVSKSKAAQDLEKAGNVINTETSSKISKEAASTLAVFDQLKNLSGGVSSALNNAASKLSTGGDRKKIETDLYAAIKEAIQKELKR